MRKSKMSVKEIVITCVLGTALWGPIAYKMFV